MLAKWGFFKKIFGKIVEKKKFIKDTSYESFNIVTQKRMHGIHKNN